MSMNNPKIEPIPEVIADTRQLCEIRFDCLVTMHDVAFRKYNTGGIFGQEKQSRVPQWFRAKYELTLESVKYMDEYQLGSFIKQMFRELEQTIDKYENNS